MEIDRQKLFLDFLKICSYVVNTLIVIGIIAFVVWYIMGLIGTANAPVHFTH